MASEGMLPVPGGEVWYRIEGEGPGVPLLVLHGGPGAGSATVGELLELADARPVILYDQLGCCRSPAADDAKLWRLERFVDEVAAVRRGLGLDAVDLLGHSWGGFLAVEYALQQPAGLRRLVLCGAAASTAEFEREVQRLIDELPPEAAATMRRHQAAGTTADGEYFTATLEFLKRHLCRLEVWPPSLLEADPMATPAYREMWGETDFDVTGNLRGWDRTARLAEIAVPTLVLCGRYDEVTPACAETLHHGIPGSTLHVFEGSSHMPFLEEPEEFFRVVRRFLS